jgi:Ca-activated chloride channel family protein
MITVAKDVKAGVVFNPEYVESYRLIGYENKVLTQDQFEDSKTDAGEIGSGHTLTVCYEIVLTDKEFVEGESLADVKIKYKPTENVGGDAESEKELTLAIGTESYHALPVGDDAFIAAVVEFALVLRDSEYKGSADLEKLIERLEAMDLSGDKYKEEFKDIVKMYFENKNK